MSNLLQIYCKNTNTYHEVEGGITLKEISDLIRLNLPYDPIGALVNNKTENLSYAVFSPKQIEFLSKESTIGRRIYVRSLCMILYKAVMGVFGNLSLKIEHAVSNGYYCRLRADSGHNYIPTQSEIETLKKKMAEIVSQRLEFVRYEKLSSDVLEIFRAEGLKGKTLLLETTHDLYTTFYRIGKTADSYYGPLAHHTGQIDIFNLIPYEEGMLLLAFDSENPKVPAIPTEQKKLYKAFTDYLKFNHVLGVSNVGELNMAVKERRTATLINTAEALHDKLLGRISDRIAERYAQGGARIILVAGPSSSGKTTSAKRLAIQLLTNLIVPKVISLDDYFVDRYKTPRDATGDYDYEHLHALDLDRLNSDLSDLLKGETINLPTYSFELGQRIEKEKPLKLEKNEVLLIEGIHGLNPELLTGIDSDMTFKVYVSALTTICIDDHNWISTTDNRLLRRIMRDYKYRHTSAYETLRRWPSVRRGEERWIFPFQENADAMFNSSLLFEIGVMKEYVLPLLKSVPNDSSLYAEAYRLRTLLNFFDPIPADQIPTTSLLREFLGGSSFRY